MGLTFYIPSYNLWFSRGQFRFCRNFLQSKALCSGSKIHYQFLSICLSADFMPAKVLFLQIHWHLSSQNYSNFCIFQIPLRMLTDINIWPPFWPLSIVHISTHTSIHPRFSKYPLEGSLHLPWAGLGICELLV